ncbi:hypothetical protein [Legionella sp. PC997]|uniref:hypothetical protein n=1 Tax=Legionella sp. PC997 TaxID=2755562 RepID=UPI0015F96759|nr:hypothetical protein [Legionella sp. PC997]QMT59792.1 hypothetical protein HBNCFIEN_01159 [Legionella sp. PC997]
MHNETLIKTSDCCRTTVTHINWTGIIAGAFVGVGLGFLLNLFGMAIGLSAYSSSPNGAAVIAIGGVIGLLIGVIAAMGAAGFVAGYVGRFYHCYCHGGVLYGFITWSLALILSILLIGPTANYISSYENALSPSFAPVEVTNSVVGDKVVAGEKNNNNPGVSVQAKHLAWSGWVLFILFFVGAFSCCIGACLGMRCKKEEVEVSTTVPPRNIPNDKI